MPNPPFSKQDMYDDLLSVVCVTANHVARYGSMEAAEALVGFAPQDPRFAYLSDPPEKFDLTRFRITGLVDRAFDYAFQVGEPMPFDASEAEEMEAFAGGANRCANDNGESPMADPSSMCRIVAETAVARWEIENGCEVSIRRLALLVGMEEAAVQDRLAAERVELEQGRVQWHEAYHWLRKHPAFIDSLDAESRSRRRRANFHYLFSSRGASVFASAMRTAGLEPADLARKAGVELARIHGLEAGKPELDVDSARRIAEALEVDIPSFVAATVEVAHAPG